MNGQMEAENELENGAAEPGGEERNVYQQADALTDLPNGGAGASGGPAWFDRKKVMLVICFAFVGVVIAAWCSTRGSQNERLKAGSQATRPEPPVNF